MEPAEIERIHSEHWRTGWASVEVDEVAVFQDLIAEHRPSSFIEIGTASGLSGAFICLLMSENGGERFVTLDHDNTFFGDTTKENGYLLPVIYPDGPVEVVRRPFTLSSDIPSFGETYEMAFVDANHQHPWPLIDTLCLYPFMRGPKLVLEHDLNLYRQQSPVVGIGPKYLYDQFPDSHRTRAEANYGNLFALSLDLPQEEMERIAMQAFHLPWTVHTKIQPPRLKAFRAVLRAHYSPQLLKSFNQAVRKHNHDHGGATPARPSAPPSAAQQSRIGRLQGVVRRTLKVENEQLRAENEELRKEVERLRRLDPR
jgi:hypothetical protein